MGGNLEKQRFQHLILRWLHWLCGLYLYIANGILNTPYDSSAEAEMLYSSIVKAMFENNRIWKMILLIDASNHLCE
ncbi:hypothetical protein CMV_008791 [Castanea mollissima]|uniref:Uncharacterized protein n=1 Tax=Castanea mollissima TaxID=60419 RepID=A0A8J4W1U3_9ROSI|nr:hypothetical protein CMV_008791 [Castanea mollissima]